MTDTIPAAPPEPCSCDIGDKLDAILKKQKDQDKEMSELRAEVGQCINYIRQEALSKAIALRKAGIAPEAWAPEPSDEPTQPGR